MVLPELLLDESNAVPDTRFAPALSAPLRRQTVLLLQYFNSPICVARSTLVTLAPKGA